MTFVKGFKSQEEAKKYQKEHGGIVCSANKNKYEYNISCQATQIKAPYLVVIRDI